MSHDRSHTHELAIVGGGNMGAALLGGLLTAGTANSDQVAVIEVGDERRQQLAEQFPGVTVSDAMVPASAAVLAVKPPDIPAVATEAVAGGARRLLSIAAGVTIATIEAAAGPDVAVIRAMPNTPALVGQGVSAIAGGAAAGPSDIDWADSVLSGVGLVVRVDEAQLDAVTGLTGSGPAYVFRMAEALIDAGVAVGLASDMVATMVSQLLVGSSALLAERGDPAGLRRMVTSPNGTTAAGLAELERLGFADAVVAAVQAATNRSQDLGRS